MNVEVCVSKCNCISVEVCQGYMEIKGSQFLSLFSEYGPIKYSKSNSVKNVSPHEH